MISIPDEDFNYIGYGTDDYEDDGGILVKPEWGQTPLKNDCDVDLQCDNCKSWAAKNDLQNLCNNEYSEYCGNETKFHNLCNFWEGNDEYKMKHNIYPFNSKAISWKSI